MKPEFSWGSPVGICSLMFIVIALIYIVIGSLGLLMIWKYGSGNFGQFYFSKQVDELIFGKPTKLINEEFPQFGKYITNLMMVFCSFMVGMGLFQLGVARFALINGEWWAYWSSVISNLIMLSVYWFIIIIPVLRTYHVGYFSLWHPYAFIPTLALPIGIIYGWIGLKALI